MRFLASIDRLPQHEFAYRRPAGDVLIPLHRVLTALHAGNHPSLWTRSVRKLLRSASRLFEGISPLNSRSFRWAEIYHSPMTAIPQATRAMRRLRCFLTVYDLIPRRFPELSPEGALAILNASLGSLRPDDTVLCISEATKSDLCNEIRWLDPNNVIVTYLGASQRFRPPDDPAISDGVRSKYGIPPGPYVLSLSAREPRKGLDHLIHCFGRLVTDERLSDLNLVLAGPRGWKDEKILQALTTSAGLRDRVIITGRVDDADLPALYGGALFFAFLSIYEGFGLPVLEAMQCGTPVISSNASSLPEVVGDGGILVEPRDVDSLCEAMLSLYRDETRRRDLSLKAIARARHFSWEKCARETVAAYRRALS